MASESICEGDKNAVKLIEDKTIGQLFDVTCRNQGLREALVFPDEQIQLTFTQLSTNVNKVAVGLCRLGLQNGDRVVLWGANHSNHVISVFACAKIGAVFCPLSHACNAETLKTHLCETKAKAIICFPTIKNGHCLEMLRTLEPRIDLAKGPLDSKVLPALKFIIFDEEECSKNCTSFAELLDSKDKFPDSIQISPENVAAIVATSGSSDETKLCRLSHYQLVNSCLVGAKRLNLENMSTILCCPLPIFRGPVLCLALLSTAVVGAKVVYPSPLPMPPTIFQSIQNQRCTCLLSNPIALSLMLRMPAAKKFSLDSLSCVCLGGDHATLEHSITLASRLQSLSDIAGGVFLTEAGFMPFVYPVKSKFEEIGKFDGKISNHYAAKVVGFDDTKSLPFGKPGRICLKLIGGSKFLGYLDENFNNTCLIDDGWFLTDDVGTLNHDGFVTLLCKANEIIFKNGASIVPTFIEKVLSAHPSIIGCQVVGSTLSKSKDVKLIAFMVKKDKQAGDDQSLKKELLDLCRKEKIDIPDDVRFVEEFPRNQAKKIQKNKLKSMIAS